MVKAENVYIYVFKFKIQEDDMPFFIKLFHIFIKNTSSQKALSEKVIFYQKRKAVLKKKLFEKWIFLVKNVKLLLVLMKKFPKFVYSIIKQFRSTRI